MRMKMIVGNPDWWDLLCHLLLLFYCLGMVLYVTFCFSVSFYCCPVLSACCYFRTPVYCGSCLVDILITTISSMSNFRHGSQL